MKLCKNVILAKSVKRNICDIKCSRLGHDLPISVNDRVIFSSREGFSFTKLRSREFRENKTLVKNLRIHSMKFGRNREMND